MDDSVHLAGPPGEFKQYCTDCGEELAFYADDGSQTGAFPEGDVSRYSNPDGTRTYLVGNPDSLPRCT